MKKVIFRFRSWNDIRYYNEFMYKCKVQETNDNIYPVAMPGKDGVFSETLIMN